MELINEKRRFLQGLSNSTRGIFGSGATPTATTVLDYITIASTGNATNFGDDLIAREENNAAMSSPTRGVWAGGVVPPACRDEISYIAIPTQGNAVDFGNLSAITSSSGGNSNGHGGL